MGQTLHPLSSRKLSGNPIFNNRFVVEVCEKIHVHYRNLRIVLSLHDWLEMARGMRDALIRWEKLGNPEPGNKHIELCRKEVAKNPVNNDIVSINLNRNLYLLNEGKIFSEGSGLDDPSYIHLKIRDQRIELSLGDFNILADAVLEAKDFLCAQQS